MQHVDICYRLDLLTQHLQEEEEEEEKEIWETSSAVTWL